MRRTVSLLVYLDSSHLAWIEQRARRDPIGATAFVQAFDEMGCALAISLHHLQEIGQLADSNSVQRRLAILGRVTRLHGGLVGSAAAISGEIRTQLVAVAQRERPRYEDLRPILFPASDPEALRRMALAGTRRFKLSRLLHTDVAELQNISKRGMEEIEAILGSRGKVRRLLRGGCVEEIADGLRSVAKGAPAGLRPGTERLANLVQKERNIRSAMEAFYQINGFDVTAQVPDADLPMVAMFFALARAEAQQLDLESGEDQRTFAELVPRLNPYECPGYRLKLALDRARERTPRLTEPGDVVDSDHVVLAPYADIAVVDKRTLELLQQEARRGTSVLPGDALEVFRRASSLEDLYAVIAQAAERRT